MSAVFFSIWARLLCDVETISLQRGIELSRCRHYSFFLLQPLRWYSALQDLELVGMFYADEPLPGKLIFLIDTFF